MTKATKRKQRRKGLLTRKQIIRKLHKEVNKQMNLFIELRLAGKYEEAEHLMQMVLEVFTPPTHLT